MTRPHLGSLADRLDRWSGEGAVAAALGSAYSYHVLDVATRDVLAARAAAEPRVGASCMKLLTAVSALGTFPSDHRFRSEVLLERPVGGARGHSSLVLRGGGDPSLEPARIADLADATTARLSNATTADLADAATGDPGGHRPVRVMVDEGLFPPPTPAPGWRPQFMPIEVQPVVPLQLREYFGFHPGEAVGVAFVAALRARGVDASFSGVCRMPAVAMDTAAGSAAVVGSVAGPASGEGVSGGGSDRPGAEVLAFADSANVRTLVTHMLQSSHNPTAEMLHRLVAIARGFPPSWEGAASAALASLEELGVPTGGVVPADGSGLSRDGRVRADQLTAVLARVCDRGAHPEFATIFPGGGLPLAGVTGSISAANDWFARPPVDRVRGRLWAKSGSLSGVVALAGIALPASGRWRTFAILVNGVEGRFPHLSARRQVERFAMIVLGIDG
jgi:D-alanyl-D-alanine carboxypeptidase/D-alanyl-D-alanine-endopeptidase (penicillin-binding protein 4)